MKNKGRPGLLLQLGVKVEWQSKYFLIHWPLFVLSNVFLIQHPKLTFPLSFSLLQLVCHGHCNKFISSWSCPTRARLGPTQLWSTWEVRGWGKQNWFKSSLLIMAPVQWPQDNPEQCHVNKIVAKTWGGVWESSEVVLLGDLYQSFFPFSFNDKMLGLWLSTMAKDEWERVLLPFLDTHSIS